MRNKNTTSEFGQVNNLSEQERISLNLVRFDYSHLLTRTQATALSRRLLIEQHPLNPHVWVFTRDGVKAWMYVAMKPADVETIARGIVEAQFIEAANDESAPTDHMVIPLDHPRSAGKLSPVNERRVLSDEELPTVRPDVRDTHVTRKQRKLNAAAAEAAK